MRYLLLWVFCFSIGICRGQLIYSLDDDAAFVAKTEKELAAAVTDSARAYTCLKLSVFCKLTNDTLKAQQYLRQGLALSEKIPFLHAASFFYRAHALYSRRDIPAIERHLMTGDSLLNAFSHTEAFKVRAYIWHSYGNFQQMKGDEEGAMDAFVNKALPYARKSGDQFVLGNVRKAIAIVFMNANQRGKAADYLAEAIMDMEASPDDNPTKMEGIAETRIIAAENDVYLNRPDRAKLQLDLALSIIHVQPKSNLYLGYSYAEGIYYDKLQRYTHALYSFNRGLALAREAGAQFWLNRLLYAQYKTLDNSKNYPAAAEVLAELVANPGVFTTDKKIYYKELYTIQSKLGNTSQALRWAGQYIQLSDSLHEAEVRNSIVELETRYNNAENQKKISMLQAEKDKARLVSKNNRLIIGLLGTATLFLTVLSILGFRFYKNTRKLAEQKELRYRQQLTEVKQQQQLQLTQALLQGEEKERKRLAGDLHDGLGGMLAGVKIHLSGLSAEHSEEVFSKDLPRITRQLDRAVNELRRIARNMMPETLLNSGLELAIKDLCESLLSDRLKLDFQALNIRKDIPQDMQVTIFRIVQELLANALRHAGASYILVQCSQEERAFYITVEDNGKGFDLSDRGNGIGLTNVRNRVGYLNGRMDISSVPGEGTTINIEFDLHAQ